MGKLTPPWSEMIGRFAGAVLAGRASPSSGVVVKVSTNGGNGQPERENKWTQEVLRSSKRNELVV